jgi:hypothetical protein
MAATCSKFVNGRVTYGACGKPAKVGGYVVRDYVKGDLLKQYLADGWLATTDEGKVVKFDDFYCGRHAAEADHALDIADLSETDEAFNTGLARLDYERRKAERKARDEQFRLDYERSELVNSRVQHTLTIKVKYERETEMEIADAENGRGVSNVRVSREAGQVRVSTSDYCGFTGRGRGNPSWTARMLEALTIAQKMQAANVTTLPVGEDGAFILPE